MIGVICLIRLLVLMLFVKDLGIVVIIDILLLILFVRMIIVFCSLDLKLFIVEWIVFVFGIFILVINIL